MMIKTSSFRPVGKMERLAVVDALRGFALLGIIIANVPYAPLSGESANPGVFWTLDSWLQMGFELFIDKKFITIFSLLFGFGFYIQYSRAVDKGINFKPYFVKRMLLLLLIGAIHGYAFWFGDIIRYYAIGGLFLLLVYRLPSKKILAVALCFSVLLTGIVYIANAAFDLQVYEYDQSIVNEMYVTPSFLRHVSINYTIDSIVNFVQDSPIILTFTFGNMMLGFWLGQIGFFHNPGNFLRMMKKWIAFGATLGLLASICFWTLNHGMLELTPSFIWIIFAIVGGMLLQSLFYIGSFILAFATPAGKRILAVFEPIGRMALTNYLLQTIFFLLFFYHWTPGPHFYGKIGVGPTYLVAIVFFALQVLFSKWWLAKHAQGPVEAVWKRLSYPKRIAMAGQNTWE